VEKGLDARDYGVRETLMLVGGGYREITNDNMREERWLQLGN